MMKPEPFKTVPQLFCNATLIPGGYANAKVLDERGALTRLIEDIAAQPSDVFQWAWSRLEKLVDTL